MAKKKAKEEAEETPKKTESKSSAEKECLIDLVNESELPLFVIMMDLSRTGLDKQFEEETRLKQLGEEIPKTITKSEFNKIIGV